MQHQETSTDPHQAGLFGSLKGLAATGVTIILTRLELLATEIEEEKLRLIALLVATLSAVFFLMLAIIFATLFTVAAFWDTNRLFVLGVFTILFLIAGAISFFIALARGHRKSPPLHATLGELARDREQLSQ